MIPTAVSQIIEQLVNAGVSIAAGYMLMKAYSSASNASAYGAAGSTLGTAMGAGVDIIPSLHGLFPRLWVTAERRRRDCICPGGNIVQR